MKTPFFLGGNRLMVGRAVEGVATAEGVEAGLAAAGSGAPGSPGLPGVDPRSTGPPIPQPWRQGSALEPQANVWLRFGSRLQA